MFDGNLDGARAALMTLQKKMAAYEHAVGLLYYDGATTAPKETAENRAVTISILTEEMYRFSTSEKTVELLTFLDSRKDELDAKEKRMVHLLIKDLRELEKIPMEEYVAYQELLVRADDVWHRAKEASDFELFRPLLEEIFATAKRFAGYVAPEKAPYDYLLNNYEEGLTQ
ncbi:MAG: carboxypeptidase M32, partial [Mogibacterium sp.]|nr:carboxypeptidase M32 [Mogibacterium sp.]